MQWTKDRLLGLIPWLLLATVSVVALGLHQSNQQLRFQNVALVKSLRWCAKHFDIYDKEGQ